MVSSNKESSFSDTNTRSGLREVVEMLGGMVAGGEELASCPGRSANNETLESRYLPRPMTNFLRTESCRQVRRP